MIKTKNSIRHIPHIAALATIGQCEGLKSKKTNAVSTYSATAEQIKKSMCFFIFLMILEFHLPPPQNRDSIIFAF